jgi:endonuclease IV
MASIGFTTGSLYRSNFSFDEIIKLYDLSGADAIELSFATPSQFFEYELSEQSINNIKKFKSISIHAPWKEVRYSADSVTKNIIEKLKSFCDKFSVEGIVLHPDTIDDFGILVDSGLPFLLENMDKRKTFGTHPDHFRELKRKYNFGFVLDIEHAYEHDSSMQLAKELIDVMGDRLKHMHVSGSSDSEIHVLTYCATNREAITKILELNVSVPKILEGILLTDVDNSIIKELAYVKKYEKK